MPQSLRYDPVATKARQGLLQPLGSALLLVTLLLGLGILFAFKNQTPLAAFPPLALQILPVAVVVLPLLTGLTGFVKPMRYQISPGETVLQRRIWVASFGATWWTLGLLLPALVLGVGVLAIWAARNVGNNALDWISLGGSFALAFGLAIFYSAMLFLESETRVDDEGIRMGTNHFLEWENIARVQKSGGYYEVFHLKMPHFPATAFRPTSPHEEEIWLDWLQRKGIHFDASNTESKRGAFVPIVAFGILALFVLGLAAILFLPLDPRWSVVGLLVISIGAQVQLEKARGLSLLTKITPPVDPATLQN